MKNHEQNMLLPETCAKFSEGDVLNFNVGTGNYFTSLETWYFA